MRDELFFFMGFLTKIYRWANLTSIDVSAGAAVCAAFFGNVTGAKINASALLALSLTVWIIYTTDHLLDSKKIKANASTFRHRFFQSHQPTFIVLLLVVVMIDFIIVINFPESLLIAGLGLILPIIFYLLLQRYLSPFKELCGALLYTCGVVLPAFVLKTIVTNSFFIVPALQFLLVAWMNLLLFSLFDKESDEFDNHISFSTKFGKDTTRLLILVIFVAIVVLTIYQIFWQNWLAGLIMFVMSFVLLIILIKRKRFVVNERFRLTGDAVFFLPLLYFLLHDSSAL
jgi:hypothetical protein